MISLAYAMGMLLALTREQPRAAMLTAPELASEPGARSDARGGGAAGAARGRRHRRPSVSGRGAGRSRLHKRGVAIDLATDTRAAHFKFPARAVHLIPSATLRGRNPLALARTAALLALGTAKAWAMLGRIKPRRRGRLRRLSDRAAAAGGDAARHADRAARAERRHGPRQSAAGAARDRRSPPAFARWRGSTRACRARSPSPAIRCGREVIAAAATPYAAPRAERQIAPAGVRRQPGRARDGRDRAGGDRAADAPICARGLSIVQQARARGPRRACARLTPGSGSTAEMRAVLSPTCRRAWRPPIW